jgi:predicted nucleotidyltransferase
MNKNRNYPVSHGLKTRDIETIYAVFKKYPEIQRVCLFGSRALGKAGQGSDIDLAVMNTGIGGSILSKIKGELEESSLPYFVDLILYADLKHDELKDHIDRVGIEFYTNKER